MARTRMTPVRYPVVGPQPAPLTDLVGPLPTEAIPVVEPPVEEARVIVPSASSSSTAGPSSASTSNAEQSIVPKKVAVKRARKDARRLSESVHYYQGHPDWLRRSKRLRKEPERLQEPSKKEYFISQVIYSRDVARTGKTMKEYLVKWWGYPKLTWEPKSKMTGCDILLKLHNAHMVQFALWLEELNLDQLVSTIREQGNRKLEGKESEFFGDFMIKFVIQSKANYSNWELYHLFNYERYTEACSQDRADEEGTDEKYGTDDLVSILKYTREPMLDDTV